MAGLRLKRPRDQTMRNLSGETEYAECKKAPFMGPLGINMAVKERFESTRTLDR